MNINGIHIVKLGNALEVYRKFGIDYRNSIQIVHDYGTENEQAIYVGKLIYGLDAERDFTFTNIRGKVHVMDGVKRLNAIFRFMEGHFAVGGKFVNAFSMEELNKPELIFTVIGNE
ncbi:hypothetical protein NDS46_30490 (plasmid) [Paenibacillus thiaminolyticus]|uniref:hypothetical protein n=1 Tax=Paenibacillus thiaminolyticus TaxID=49283 RepID=UPI00232DD958|nr:hypothetical protein [Paenibacillus thiaminolyticus]WCF11678.1 hypothetical protein NDS46_30490 [Paenibacillus thiaminolyticus]